MGARQLLRLSDGRDLEYARNAVVSSSAVVFHQGTLADLTVWESWLAELETRGVGAVAFNRSGYANSSPKPGRRTLDVGRDVAELADVLGLTDFVSVGWSGGGSHALATGLDPRCRGVVTLAGIAPYGQDDLDFYEGLKSDDVAEYRAALRSVDELIELMNRPGHGQEWCEPDARALASPEMAELLAASATCTSFGLECLSDDYSAYLSPWGFDVADLTVPVEVFQGDLDENVPIGHARWLVGHIPAARLHLYPGEGHLSLVARHREDIVRCALSLLEGTEFTQE